MSRITMKESFEGLTGVVGRPRRVANNTFEYIDDLGQRVVRLHRTDIAVFDPRQDRWRLHDGGWKTHTTKDRLNSCTPFRISSVKGEWVVSDGTRSVPFYDGIELPKAFENPQKAQEESKANVLLKKRIKAFLKATIAPGVELPLPSDGDCWYCRMFDAEKAIDEPAFSGWVSTDTLNRGQKRNTDHLLSHIKEGYMHGSLIVNAFRGMGYGDAGIRMLVYGGYPDYARIRRVIYTYLCRRLGLATR